MTGKTHAATPHLEYHKNGSVRARGMKTDGVLTGYWEWFRLDGTKLRSGHFEAGEQAGTWTTYDTSGQPYKVTEMSRIKKKKG